MKKIAGFIMAVLMLCAFCVTALAEESGDWEYSVKENGEAEISGYRGSSAYVQIPEELDGHPVTGIGSIAFFSNEALTGVMIPGSVKTIGESAFSFCPMLQELTICDGVENIGMYVFAQCTALKNVTIPDSVESIGEMAFGYYATDGGTFLHVPGFTICGSADSAAEQYAEENDFSFIESGACTHDTLVCEVCRTAFTKEELLTKWDDALTASTLSEGYPEIVFGIGGLAIGFIAAMIIFRKKKVAVSSTTEDEE